jgi:hypothetical protein
VFPTPLPACTPCTLHPSLSWHALCLAPLILLAPVYLAPSFPPSAQPASRLRPRTPTHAFNPFTEPFASRWQRKPCPVPHPNTAASGHGLGSLRSDRPQPLFCSCCTATTHNRLLLQPTSLLTSSPYTCPQTVSALESWPAILLNRDPSLKQLVTGGHRPRCSVTSHALARTASTSPQQQQRGSRHAGCGCQRQRSLVPGQAGQRSPAAAAAACWGRPLRSAPQRPTHKL